MTTKPNHNISFDSYFMNTFNSLIKTYNTALEKLNEVSKGKDISSEYGICNCCYKMRYITPSNISTLVSNLIKGLNTFLFHNIADVNIFLTASAKRFLEENNCIPFEMSSLMDKCHSYVNPKNHTLQDLLLITENDICDVVIYSKGEMLKRLELMESDVQKMNNMYFSVNIKKIVNALPQIINSDIRLEKSKIHLIIKYIQEFILFACAINSITILNMLGYCSPSTQYAFKKKDENDESIVTECCFVKTNDYMIRNNLPFDCNIKNIVLQDITYNFSEVMSAIKFITTDSRSPVCVLVNKYKSDGELSVQSYVNLIMKTIVGDNENSSRYSSIYDKFNINTKINWLDSITFSNNYLDGNYRRDAMGNNKSNPILNNLDFLYKTFSGCKLKTNNEIADNICMVSEIIKVICELSNETIMNYDTAKDILVVLGEIITRDMLHLYYNNTRVLPFDMVDKHCCSQVTLENFIMEADNTPQSQTPTNTNTSTSQNNLKPTVRFNDQNNNNIKPTIQSKLSSIIRQFTNWVRNSMSKFSTKFNENHKKEIEWINRNNKLNKDIEEAINSGKFNPVLTNYRRFKIPAQQLIKSNITEEVQKNINAERIKDFDIDKFIVSLGPADSNVKNQYMNEKNETKKAEIFTNYILYSSAKSPQLINGKMTAEMWKEIYTDLLGIGPMLEKIVKTNSDDLAKASEILSKESQKFEIAISSAKDEQTKKKLMENSKRIDDLYKAVQTASKIYKTTMLNVFSEKFYSVNYTLYRDIVAGYKQQNSGEGVETSNVQNPTNQNSENKKG